MNGCPTLRDDPEKDYRQEWRLPLHFVWDEHGLPMIDFVGYRTLIKELLPPPPETVLDVGCGDGYFAASLASWGYRVTGIDFSSRAVAFAKLLVPNVQFHEHDLRRLKQATWLHGKFRVVVLIEVLEHVPPEHHDGSLAGIASCLAKGGKLILSTPSEIMPRIPQDYKHFSLEELTSLLNRTGFSLEKVIYQNRLNPLFSPKLWRFFSNRHYDITLLRRVLFQLFMAHFNRVTNGKKAGRLIARAVLKP